jgi:hypothetical protein
VFYGGGVPVKKVCRQQQDDSLFLQANTGRNILLLNVSPRMKEFDLERRIKYKYYYNKGLMKIGKC